VFAISITDSVTVTIGEGGAGHAKLGFSAVPQGPTMSFGAVSPAITTDGYTYQVIDTSSGICTPRACGGGGDTLQIDGFTADPGQAWLNSISYEGCTISGATATFSYNSGVAEWFWAPPAGDCLFGTVGAKVTVQVNHVLAAGSPFYIKPKYQVVGVYYAPPGNKNAKNTVAYGTSFLTGTTAVNSSSFTQSTTVTASVTEKIFDFFSLTEMYSDTWSQEETSSDSVVLQNTISQTYTLPGPSVDGVNHAQDVIWVWLNPVVEAIQYPLAISTVAYGNDGRDPASETGQPDIIELTVAQLQSLAAGNTSIIQTEDLGAILRAWDTTWDQGPAGLTAADCTDILKADLFVANPALNQVSEPTRFDPVSTSISYTPTTGNPSSITYTGSYQNTTTAGQSGTDTHKKMATIETKLGVPTNLFSGDLKVSGTYTSTNTWSAQQTNGATQTATFTVAAPEVADGYSGPTTFLVFKDNVYGTFVFYGVYD